MNYQTQNTDELEGLFSPRDPWSKMSYNQRDNYYKDLLKQGCSAVLNGKASSLEKFMQEKIIDSKIYSKSWSKFKRKSPSTYGNIFDAQNELVAAQGIIEVAKHNAAQAMDQLSRANEWQFVDKAEVTMIVNSYVAKQVAQVATQNSAEATSTNAATQNTVATQGAAIISTNAAQTAIPTTGKLINWVKTNPLVAGGIGLAVGYVFNRMNQTNQS